MSPGGPDILSSPLQIEPAGISTPNTLEPDIPSAHSSPERLTSALPRARNAQLDWETHRPKIKKLYMDEYLSLKDTREIMKEESGFDAS